MMKLFKTISISLLALVMTVTAQKKKERVPVQAVMIMADGSFENIFLLRADKTNIFYVQNVRAINTITKKRSSFASMYLKEPREYSDAISLYEGRKYTEALAKFGAFKKRYAGFKLLPGNHYTLAEFYEMECMRKLMKLDALAAAVRDYNFKGLLLRSEHLKQVEVYAFWEAVRTKAWPRLNSLAKTWGNTKVSASQRAQIAYTHGLALEGLKKQSEALDAYATAMTADFSKSEIIVRNSALNSLRIFEAMPEVKAAIERWGTENEDKSADGYTWLLEANAIARLYNKAGLGSGIDLPKKYAEFLKYTPKGAAK